MTRIALMFAVFTACMTAQPALNAMDAHAGDFLDFPLDSVRQMAYRAYQAGHYEEAALHYLAALQHDVTNSGDIYNLACCYGLLKEETLAAMYLGRAFRAGFDDIGHVAADPDFDSVRAGLHFVATVESAAAAAARRQTTAGIRVDVVTPTMLPCYVRLPDGWSPDSSYPLVVGLHGYGSNPEQFNSLYERAGRPRVIFASLRAPYPLNIGGEPGYSWSTWTDTDTAVGPASSQMSAEAVSRLVMELKMRYRAGDVYVLGFSQGAGLAYRVGLRFGFAVRGIICFGGSLDTTRLPMSDFMVAARDTLRVFIGHGREDRVIEVSAGRASRDFLKRFGVDVTYLEFAGGHAVPEDPLRKAFGWMLKPPRTRRH